jgi:hypothetical protein
VKYLKINIKKLPKPDYNDIFIVLGDVLLGKGLHMIYPPLMFIVIGAAIIWLGLPGKAVR